jgi:hypothetical protein
VDPGGTEGTESGHGARPQDAVLGYERAVEVARDALDVAREPRRELESAGRGYWPADWLTNAATSLICWDVS